MMVFIALGCLFAGIAIGVLIGGLLATSAAQADEAERLARRERWYREHGR